MSYSLAVMGDGSLVVAYVTAPKSIAMDLASQLVERRVAACVNRVDVTSTYRWEGKIQQDPEELLVIKTSRDRFDDLCRAVHELHSYSVPEIIALPVVAADPAYASWALSEASK